MPDVNMNIAYAMAKSIGRQPRWYKKYRKQINPQMIAVAVHILDYPLVTSQKITDKQALRVLNIFLRWWSGCISMSKVIAMGTRDGPNTPPKRKKWSRQLLRKMETDPIFADGVHAAISLKRMRNQNWSFEGFENKVFNKMVDKRDIM